MNYLHSQRERAVYFHAIFKHLQLHTIWNIQARLQLKCTSIKNGATCNSIENMIFHPRLKCLYQCSRRSALTVAKVLNPSATGSLLSRARGAAFVIARAQVPRSSKERKGGDANAIAGHLLLIPSWRLVTYVRSRATPRLATLRYARLLLLLLYTMWIEFSSTTLCSAVQVFSWKIIIALS